MTTQNKLRIWLMAMLLSGTSVACQPATDIPTPTQTSQPAVENTATIPPADIPIATEAGSSLRGTIRIWLSWNVQELKSLERAIEVFQEKNPNTNLAISYFPEGALRSALEQIRQGGTAPTVLLAPSSWGAWLWREGYSLDLSSRIDAELESTIHPLAWNQVTYQDVKIGVPLEVQGVVLFRHRALIEEPATSVAEWVRISRELKDEQIIGSALDLGFDFTASQIAACAGALFDELGQITLDSPEGYCWLELMAILRPAGRVTMNDDDDVAFFEAGQAAWIIDGTWNMRRLEQAVGAENLAVDPWPVYQETGERLAGFVWTENAYLLPTSAPIDLEATWAFVRFLMTPEAQLILSEPAGADHLTVLSGLELSDALQVQLLAALFNGVPRPLREDLDLFRGPIEVAVDSVAVQGADPGLAIEIALTKIQQASSEITNPE
ncbi:MAG: extracellular solute-binding protein [Anaerolineales bacterium]|nr:extracellular solute-binding protein [Anaerolineales bacterium]